MQVELQQIPRNILSHNFKKRGRSQAAHEFDVTEKTVSRWRAAGILKVETKSAGRTSDWYITRAEIERVKKARGR